VHLAIAGWVAHAVGPLLRETDIYLKVPTFLSGDTPAMIG